MTDSVNRCTFL